MNKKPKILFVMHMPPPVHGASMVGKYIHDSELVNSEFECHYINPTTAKNLENIGKLSLTKVMDVHTLCKEVEAKIADIQPDLVYFTANAAGMPFYKDFLVMRSIKKALGKKGKIVVHYHNKGVRTKQDTKLDNIFYKHFFKGIKVILLAENLYSDIEKYVKREDVYICPNGIPEGPSHSSVRGYETIITSDQESHPIQILYLSNMMKEKGVMDLFFACDILKQREVPFHCDFVGGWKDITPLYFDADRENYNLEEECVAHGAKYGVEKEPFWNKADVFVFPTYYHNECFPLVLLEAMQHGKACISTDEAGIPGIIDDGKTGILVPKNDPEAIANAIQILAEDRKLCKQMGIAGRKKYEEEFTLERFEKRFVEVLRRVAEG